MLVLNIIFVVICTTGIRGASESALCDIYGNTTACTAESANKALYEEVMGKEGLWNSSEPLKLDLISGCNSDLSIELSDAVLSGFSQCYVEKLQLNKEPVTYVYNVGCPRLIQESSYKVKGYVEDSYVDGEGIWKVTRDDYHIGFVGNYVINTDDDGNTFLYVTKYNVSYTGDKVTYESQKLFNGDKRAFDEVFAYANENPQSMEQLLGHFVMSNFMEKYIENSNQHMKVVPLNQLISTY